MELTSESLGDSAGSPNRSTSLSSKNKSKDKREGIEWEDTVPKPKSFAQKYYKERPKAYDADGNEIPDYRGTTQSLVMPRGEAEEHSRIRTTFGAAGCWSLKKLPNYLESGEVQERRTQNTTQNRLLHPAQVYKAQTVQQYFSPLEYQYSNYDKARMAERSANDQHQMKTDSFSRKPFQVTSRIKSYSEDTFEDKEYKHPYMGPGKNKKGLQDYTRSEAFDPSLWTAGAFNPAGKKQSDVTRSKIREWIKAVFSKLSADWPNLKFTVRWTNEDEMQIVYTFGQAVLDSVVAGASLTSVDEGFVGTTPPPNNALPKYFAAFASTGLAAELKFTRRGDKWNIPDPTAIIGTETLMFVFYAPWVKRGITTVRSAMSAFQREEVRRRREEEAEKKRMQEELGIVPDKPPRKFNPGPSPFMKKKLAQLAAGNTKF
jgi:hypothetical protein